MTAETENPIARAPEVGTSEYRRLKAQILEDLAGHLRTHGGKNFDLLRERHEYAPMIGKQAGPSGERKFRNWRKSVSVPCTMDKTRPHETRAASGDLAAWASNEAATRANHPMVNVTPAYIAREGAAGLRKIDAAAEMPLALEEAERLLKSTLVRDETEESGWRIVDPQVYRDAIRLKMTILQTAANLQRQINEARNEKQFHDEIIELIVEQLNDQPELLDRLLGRIEDLDRRTGGTAQWPLQ